jgi:hypothetical protein
MSTAGIYNYHPKVEHPSHIFPQMKSDTQQPSFHFGGSQVPVALGHIHGSGFKAPVHGIDSGFRTQHKFSLQQHKITTPSFTVDGSVNGKGIRTTIEKHKNIMLPQYMSSLKS